VDKRDVILGRLLILVPSLSFANGGDQRLIERGKYFINLSRAPFTPRVGVKTSFVASFFDVAANRLIDEDLTVRIRIAKLGDAPKGNFIFDQENIVVKGGVVEFPYTFNEPVLHEIFFDFAFASNPKRVYNAPDFLLDVQRGEQPNRADALSFFLTGCLGFVLGFLLKRRLPFHIQKS